MITRQEILAKLTELKPMLSRDYSVKEIGLFGSYAREEATDTSDIDIIIEFEDNTDNLFDKKYELREYLMSYFHKNIDLCRQGAIKPVFRNLILKDAIYA